MRKIFSISFKKRKKWSNSVLLFPCKTPSNKFGKFRYRWVYTISLNPHVLSVKKRKKHIDDCYQKNSFKHQF